MTRTETHHDAYDFHADLLPTGTLADIDGFWAWFSEKAAALDAYFSSQGEQAETDPYEVMGPLNEKWPDLMWEFGPSDRGHMLIITAEWQDENRALARALRRRAPKFDRWEIIETRPACELGLLIQTFEARFQSQFILTDMQASVADNGRIDLAVEGYGTQEDLIQQGIELTTLLLGEEGDRDWLGLLEATPIKKPGGILSRLRGKTASDFDVAAALTNITSAIDQAKSERPEQAYHATGLDDRGATLFEVGTAPQDHPRPDLITYMAPSERFGRAVLGAERFSSACHSAHGESFVTLRIPNQDGAPWDAKARADIEDALHEKLSEDGVGGQVGGGSGKDAAYIDLAFIDVASGIARVAQTLRATPFAADITFHFMDPGLTETAHPLLGGAPSVQ